jgi:hypothetical protein
MKGMVQLLIGHTFIPTAYCCSYKPDADEKECIVAHRNETKSEFDCGADAGNPGFLAADPVRGCVCEETLTPNFCGGK